jgi:hypothetical protein
MTPLEAFNIVSEVMGRRDGTNLHVTAARILDIPTRFDALQRRLAHMVMNMEPGHDRDAEIMAMARHVLRTRSSESARVEQGKLAAQSADASEGGAQPAGPLAVVLQLRKKPVE